MKFSIKFPVSQALVHWVFLILLHGTLFSFSMTQISRAQSLEANGSGNPVIEEALANLKVNDLPETVKILENRIKDLDPGIAFLEYIDCVLLLESAYRTMGMHTIALDRMIRTVEVIEKQGSHRAKAIFFSTLSDLYLTMGNLNQAMPYAEKAREHARIINDPRLIASVLNNYANVLACSEDTVDALMAFDNALSHVEKIKHKSSLDLGLKTAIQINRLKLLVITRHLDLIVHDMENVYSTIDGLTDSPQKADQFLSFGKILVTALENEQGPMAGEDRDIQKGMAYKAFTESRRIAFQLKMHQREAMATGSLGKLYEIDTRFDEAILLTKQAIVLSLQSKLPEKLYLWQWQLGRLLKKTGKSDASIHSYEQAIDTLEPIKTVLFKGFRGRHEHFRQKVRPVYLELAQLYLENATKLPEGELKKDWLIRARDTMEKLKILQLQDFFQDECIAAAEKQLTRIDHPDPNTAIIYPILMPGSIQILLFFSDRVSHLSIPMDYKDLERNVKEFRKRLQNMSHQRYRFYSQKLYNSLIRPLENELEMHKIRTLVIVPDGVLHLIPFSALYNGTSYLVEKYELSTVPGVTLVSSGSFDPDKANILLGGLSGGITNFQDLPHVPQELATIKDLAKGTILLDKDFTLENLESHLEKQNYNMVHLATHGVFEPDARSNYLKTHDGKITMEELRQLMAITRFRKKPVELLTLSSCQTALGDERAALGLGGVALKAGVETSLATLWLVSDKAASMVTTEFYRQLLTQDATKAQALQQAQKKLIQDPLFSHPAFWAPFLLIGGWL
ncbi:MAG: CHAT domain-containing protein [Desulfobacteraceae bacterium]|nr:CHAT domain-containing protein [Desulfobacteraceae bacterium]